MVVLTRMDIKQSGRVLDFYSEKLTSIGNSQTLAALPDVETASIASSVTSSTAALTPGTVYLGLNSEVHDVNSGLFEEFEVDDNKVQLTKFDGSTLNLSQIGLQLKFYYQRDPTTNAFANQKFGLKFVDDLTRPEHFNIVHGDTVNLLANWFKYPDTTVSYHSSETSDGSPPAVYNIPVGTQDSGKATVFDIGNEDTDDFKVVGVEPIDLNMNTPLVQCVTALLVATFVNLAIAGYSSWFKEIPWWLKHIFNFGTIVTMGSCVVMWFLMNDINITKEPILVALIPFILYAITVFILYIIRRKPPLFSKA